MDVAVSIRVRELRHEDWPEVARIYEQGIETGDATFETSVPSWRNWDAAHLEAHRLVLEHLSTGGDVRILRFGLDHHVRVARLDVRGEHGVAGLSREPGERR